MIIRDVINYTGGTQISFTGREYLAPNGSDTLVIALHPDELRGPADGSQLNKLESIDWWPKFAKSVDYPFNIFAVQNSGSTFHYLLKDLIPAMKQRYNPKNIVLIGLGRGAVDVYNLLSENTDSEIKLIVAVSGNSERSGSIFRWPLVRGQAYHGTGDTHYTLTSHRDTVNKYNDTHGANRIQFIELQGVGHDAWKHAFNQNPANDPAFQFVKEELQLDQPAPPPDDNCDDIRQQLAAMTAERDNLRAIINAAYNELG